jgi:hypothetical protein
MISGQNVLRDRGPDAEADARVAAPPGELMRRAGAIDAGDDLAVKRAGR